MSRNFQYSCFFTGENIKLHNAYVWDDVTICDNCDIRQSILCNKAHIKGGVTVEPRCILSYEVVVGPDVTIPPQTFLMSTPQEAENDSDDEDKIPEVSKGEGFLNDLLQLFDNSELDVILIESRKGKLLY